MQYAYTIRQFCGEIGISAATFYRRRDEMPRVVKIGFQSRILHDDYEAWLARIQRDADAGEGRAAT